MSCATTAHCPHCHATLRITSRRLDGKHVTCPGCGGEFCLERVRGRDSFTGVILITEHSTPPALPERPPARPDMTARDTVDARPANTVSYERARDGRLALLYRRTRRLMAGGAVTIALIMMLDVTPTNAAPPPRIEQREESGDWPVWRGPSRDGVVPAGPPLASPLQPRPRNEFTS